MKKQRWFETEGNNGGSYIRLTETGKDGIIRLEVGETCVRTIDEEIPLCALAMILTHAKDIGWRKMIADYGCNDPDLWVSADPKSGAKVS